MPIIEAARAAELLLGPYTGEDNVKRQLVVREARLNRVYALSVRLAERPNPNMGKKKHAHVLEVNRMGPIVAAPLRDDGPYEEGGPSHAAKDTTRRTAKRVAQGTMEQVERAGSISPSSGGCGASPMECAAVEAVERATVEADKVVGSFAIAHLPIEESSDDSTPSHVYDGGAGDTGDAHPTPRAPIGMHHTLFCPFSVPI